jgi:putative DNA-binding protein
MLPPGSSRLEVIQRWMQSVIVHPGGVEAGIESPAAQNEVAVPAGRIEEVICRSKSQSSMERLAVYSNAYKARLLEVLMGDYPALVHAIGEVFTGMASAYLEDCPSTSYTLTDLGRSFPEYLARSRPANENEDGAPDWADFLIDLARLERMYSEVFDGPGMEAQSPLSPDDIRAMSPEEWLTARLVPAPCLRLATFRFPVHEYASAVRHQQESQPPDANATHLAITRRDYIVRRAALNELEFNILSTLVEGGTVSEALEEAMAMCSESVDNLADELSRWFRNWSAAGYFAELAS